MILIIIVIVIVVKRGNRSPAKLTKAQASRDVVAFENPMYVSAKPAQSNPDHYDNTVSDASAGLYDEPAFVGKSEKDNPLYEDTDNFDDTANVLKQHAEGSQITEGASLFDPNSNVAGGEDGGYLDVAD